MKILRSIAIPALAILLPTVSIHNSHAQSPRALEVNRAAYEQYMTGNYDEAEKLYNQLLRDYPTDQLVPIAQVQLGFTKFFQGQFDEANQILEKAEKDPTVPEELQPVIASFIPQVYSAKAMGMERTDPKRLETFQTAIKRFGDYIEKYPKGDELENVRFGRALAKYQIEDFDGAIQDLEQNLAEFSSSPTVQDSENLLALTLATQASVNLAENENADREAEFARFNRSKALLEGIINRKTNLTLVNDARFQLAEILFGMAAFSPEEERPELYKQAMAAYREVTPNEEMIALQEEKLATYPERRRQIITNPIALKILDREIDREQRRLSELQGKPDLIASSALKMGEIYFHLGDMNKSRVALRHVTPFLEREDDQKRALYFLTLSYILQNQKDQALEFYAAFQEKYKGDPMAQNLPLAMGNLLLSHPDPAQRNVEEAIRFFDESLEIYPDGSLSGLTIVTKASAQVGQGKMAEAEKTFQEFLAGDPTPDEALVARMGLGDIYVRGREWDKAIEAYGKVLELFPDRPNAVDAEYWIAIATSQKGDLVNAIPLLKKFAENHPESPLLPNVIYTLAVAQINSGDLDSGAATLADLAERFPESEPAPFTFFQRAQILEKQQKPDEADAVLKEFLEKYPQDPRVFFAFDLIAQKAYRAGNWEAAIAQYNTFVKKYPDAPQAPVALLKISEFNKQWADSLGRYGALTTDEQAVWKQRMDAAILAAATMVEKYPASPELPLGIQNLIATQEALIAAGIQTPQDLETYIKQKAAIAEPAVKSKLLFGLASWIAKSDPEKALQTMEEAYQPDIVYAPADLDTYGLALLDNNKVDEAAAVFEKLKADYPLPADTPLQNVPAAIQQAQAIATFGLARVAQEKGDIATAGELFKQLKELYGWSPKVLDAELGILEAEVQAGKLDEPLARLPALIRAPNASAEVRAKAMLLGGDIMRQKAKAATDATVKKDSLGAAIDYYIKIDQFYGGVPAIAAQGLWEGAQLLEEQANAAGADQQFRQRQMNLARKSYQDLVKKYPNSPFAEQASARIRALGAE